MNLYQITSEYQSLLNNLSDPETGEINEEAFKQLEIIQDKVENKSISIASFIKNLEAEKKAIEDAKKSMANRESKLENKIELLTSYLKTNMEKTGISEVSCPYFSIKIKKCPISVDILNEDEISDRYKKIKETISIDKIKIKEDIQAGMEVKGAVIKQNLRLEIK